MNSRNFRYPPVLADQLRIAFRHIRSIDEEHGDGSALVFLERHRRNQGRRLTSALAKRDFAPAEIEPLPLWLSYSGLLDEIDRAFKAMHRYDDSGVADYISRDVYAEVRDEVVSVRQRNAAMAQSSYRSEDTTALKQQVIAHAKDLLISDEITRDEFYRQLESFTEALGEKRARRTIRGYLKEAGVKPPPK